MAFVNRFIVLSGSVTASATAETVETHTVREGSTTTTVGFWTNEDTDLDYTLRINETTVLDDVNGANLPNAEDPLRYEVELQGGDSITLICDNGNTGSAVDAEVVFMVEDTQESFPNASG